jgi:eukaryotic-like serine/threonine-protein kinase
MLSPGSIFAGYQIERVLGGGGMGTVYLARNPDLPRSEALKVLSAELSGDEDFRARFIREAEVASALDHPNIVSIHQRGEFEGQLWIAMQFVDGTDANAALRAGAMTPARAVHIVGEVAKALDYAHQRGVVHRDIKPANFLLSGPSGADERVLLGDFGIARALDDAGLTITGSVTATVAYAAPEVLAGQPSDGRADLYSLGCALFRLLTGWAPYPTANGPAAVVAAHLHAAPPKVTDLVPGLSAQMDRVIATAMAKDPSQRFASARALADAATAALNEQLGSTTAPWHPVPSSAPPVDGPPQWATGPYSATAPVGFRQLPPFAPPPRRRPHVAAVVGAVVIVVAALVVVAVLTTKSRPDPGAASSATSTPTTAAPAGPLDSTALTGLLLSPERVAGMVGASALVQESFADTVVDDSAKLTEKDCIGVMAPAQHLVYSDAGWTGIRSQALRNAGEGPRIYAVIQAVISFPTADAAKKLLADQQSQWASCSGRTLTLTFPAPPSPQLWVAGTPADMDATMTMTQTMKDGGGMQCQRALAVRNNVAVDVSACRYDISEQALEIVHGIAAKIPG